MGLRAFGKAMGDLCLLPLSLGITISTESPFLASLGRAPINKTVLLRPRAKEENRVGPGV